MNNLVEYHSYDYNYCTAWNNENNRQCLGSNIMKESSFFKEKDFDFMCHDVIT